MDTDLTQAALTALRKILHAAELENRRMAALTGLTPSQVLVLREVGAREHATPGAVASALRFGQATITNIVDRLVAAGLVNRNRSQNDKRQMLLQLTEQGRARLEASPFPLQARFSEGYRALPAWEQAMMLAGLERLCTLLAGAEGMASQAEPVPGLTLP
jgi:Transcriptional regulators